MNASEYEGYLQRLEAEGWPNVRDDLTEDEEELNDGYICSDDEGKPLPKEEDSGWFFDPLAEGGRGHTRRRKRKRFSYNAKGEQVEI